MSALFNFQSLLTVVLLLICTCAYIRSLAPSVLDRNKEGTYVLLDIEVNEGTGTSCIMFSKGIQQLSLGDGHINVLEGPQSFLGIFWKCARIGERKSPYVSACCIAMAFTILFWI